MFAGLSKADVRAKIEAAAEKIGFKVMDYDPGPGASAHVTLKDVKTDETQVIAVWPTSTEADLTYLLTRAAFEVRGGYRAVDCQHEGMM